MAKAKKTDNHNLAGKLALRRYFLRKYHADGQSRVLDCCQGNGVIWRTLRSEFPVSSYWGIDLKEKPGRLKMDSARVLVQQGWNQNVIDVDVYGSPWEHWAGILENGQFPLTVFLTVGLVRAMGGSPVSIAERDACGLHFRELSMPPSLAKDRVRSLIVDHCLGAVHTHGIRVIECLEAARGPHARYIGIRLEK